MMDRPFLDITCEVLAWKIELDIVQILQCLEMEGQRPGRPCLRLLSPRYVNLCASTLTNPLDEGRAMGRGQLCDSNIK